MEHGDAKAELKMSPFAQAQYDTILDLSQEILGVDEQYVGETTREVSLEQLEGAMDKVLVSLGQRGFVNASRDFETKTLRTKEDAWGRIIESLGDRMSTEVITGKGVLIGFDDITSLVHEVVRTGQYYSVIVEE